MAEFPFTLARLDGAALGVFGAGYLGGALARGLLRAGFPRDRLLVCHGGSTATIERLAREGLGLQVREAGELTRRCRVVMYCVRPADFAEIGAFPLMDGALLLSFLAGTPLARLPLRPAAAGRVRVMTSGPETIDKREAIGGIFPAHNEIAEELLRALRIQAFALQDEEGMHAFTALGVCLPIVLACWRAQGGSIDEAELARCAARHGVAAFERILTWALSAEPRFARGADQEQYLRRAATPGGVTEAMIDRIRAGDGISQALDAGVQRSRKLAS
jgi:pyrroline-5-carboxylate reductase